MAVPCQFRLASRLVAVAFLAAACYSGPPTAHFVAIIDELRVPATWDVGATIVRGPDQPDPCDPMISTGCPGVSRTFLIDGDMDAALEQAKEAVRAAGFALADAPASCVSASATGPPCGFYADRESDRLYTRVFASAQEAGLADASEPGVAVEFRIEGTG